MAARPGQFVGQGADLGRVGDVEAAALASTPVPTAVGFLPSLRSYDQYHTLGSIRANTIVVSGGADPLTPPSHHRDMAAGIPGAAHVHLPTLGTCCRSRARTSSTPPSGGR